MTTFRLFTKLSGAALMLALAAPSLALAQPSASGRGASARDAAPRATPAPVVQATPAPATRVRVVHTSTPRVVPVAQRPTQPMRVNAGLNLSVAQRAQLDALRQQRQARAAHIRATSHGAHRDARLRALNAESRAQFLAALTPAQRHQLEANRAARGTDARSHRGRAHSRGK